MKDHELEEKIRKSAETIEIPEGLKPENIETKLRKNPVRRFPVFRVAAAAAAFLLVIGLWGIHQGIFTEQIDMTTQNDLAARPESAEETLDSAPDNVDPTALASIKPISDYEELYNALLEQQSYYGSYDTGTAETAEMEIADSVMEEFAMEDSSASTTSQAAAEPGESPASYSSTNTQVDGVDEGDIIKTDGQYIYILNQNQGVRIVKADSMELVKELPLENYNEYVEEFYLDDNHLVLIATGVTTNLTNTSDSAYRMDSRETTMVYTYDIAVPEEAALTGTVSQDGYYRSSRKSGDYLYLFTDYMPNLPEKADQIQEYVPIVNGDMVLQDDIFIPEICNNTDSLVISSLDIRNPGKILDSKSILSGASDFYVSTEHIFITNSSWNNEQITQIMSFAYNEGQISPQAAGSVRGYLNDNFSLDEYDHHLRVVSTYWDEQNMVDINGLYVLDKNLKIVGRIDELAPDETIQSARFMGTTGYFVTYRQMDPLFSVDLSDPENPQILGELKITGFSEYLHFYDENLLLGIGWETDPNTGSTLGLKLSMFDISNPANVTEKDKFVIKNVFDSPAMDNYKAVMIDTEKNLFGFAYMGYEGQNYTIPLNNYSLFSYDAAQGFTEQFAYNLNNENSNTDYLNIWNTRGLYIGDNFYLSTKNALTQFDMTENFRPIGRLTW